MSREAIVGAALGVLVGGCTVEMTEAEVQSVATAPITVSPRVSAISEAGDPATFTVALQGSPHGPVRIDITIDPASEARAVPSTLIFMPNDAGPRTFQLVAVDDDVFDGDIRLAVSLNVLSADPRYRYQPPPLDVLSVDDDYVVTGYRTLALFPGADGENPVRVNNRGQVVADVQYPSNDLHAYVWDDGAITDLGSPTRANDMNDAGVVVGFLGDDRFSFRYEDGQLGDVPGQIRAINDQGDMVGDALYVQGQRTELRGGEPVSGLAINARDHVTGLFPTPPFYEYAFYWDGQLRDLGSLGGPHAAGLSINEHDQLVGFMWDAQINYHAVYYDGGSIVDLGTATGSVGALATAINNRGDIAGNDHDGGMATAGWVGRVGQLRTIQSQLVDGSCFSMMEVQDINDRGEILARGWECDVGSPHAYLFEPIKSAR
jgi:probable HAF family extracellular repeat protein